MALKFPLSSNMRSGWKGWRRKNRRAGNQTPGKLKNESCQTDPTKKFFACSPKAYKHKQYAQWHDGFKSLNGSSTSNKENAK